MTQPLYPSNLWMGHKPASRLQGLLDEEGNSFDTMYSLHSKLGDGMTACVFVAYDRVTKKTCACKLAERKAQQPSWGRLVQVLKHESAMLLRIGAHPNIVHHQGFFLGKAQVALCLELVTGGDCQQLLQRQGCLAEPAVYAMITQLSSALDHLHQQNVIHRDIKLENCLVDNEVWPPRLKLCDFGHACEGEARDGEVDFYGTPGYSSPEVMSRLAWSSAADVWAMGVVMFALLANALPYEREFSWLRPPDFSGRAWWQVSVEAKLLLQTILEADAAERATLPAVRESAWFVHGPPSAHQENPRPTLGRRGYGSMMQLGGQQPRPVQAAAAAEGGAPPLMTSASHNSSLVRVADFASHLTVDKAAEAARLPTATRPVALDVPPTRSQREVMEEAEEEASPLQQMQTEEQQPGSLASAKRGGSFCIASELASVSLRCSSDGQAESGERLGPESSEARPQTGSGRTSPSSRSRSPLSHVIKKSPPPRSHWP